MPALGSTPMTFLNCLNRMIRDSPVPHPRSIAVSNLGLPFNGGLLPSTGSAAEPSW
ncbi:ubie coq5 [Moniliophthora roreri]|nr:ubie coq5 [Moniliophthora roreri]